MTPPKLTKGYKANFKTLLRAAGNNDLVMVSAIRKADRKPVALLCAVQPEPNEQVGLIPLAMMIDGNPFEMFEDPTVLESDVDIRPSCP